MPVHNADVAKIFNTLADLLEIEGANQFRVRAYRNAARTVGNLPNSLADMVESEEDLSKLPGIGKDLFEKIEEIVKTGELKQLKKQESKTPAVLSRLMNIEGLGPKRVGILHRELDVNSVNDLKRAVRKGEVSKLKGFGEKVQQKIDEDLRQKKKGEKRIKLAEVEEIAHSLVDHLKQDKKVKAVIIAGSYRRRKETVGDLDILSTCKRGSKVMERFTQYEDVDKVVSQGKTRATVILRSGLQVDLRVVPEVSYGAALHYFTGSKSHNIAIRKLGVKKKFKINEYGVFKGKKRVAGKTEEEVYKKVDLPWIEPELRENRGEIDAARKDKLPRLITLKDVRGDLHTHTQETDGHHTLKEMAEAAQERGYDYLAITNHSKRVTMVHGLDKKGLAREIKRIDHLNGKLKNITLLKAIEVDILKDGSLDLPDDILNELDLTVCSIHYNTNLSKTKQTERIIKAMDNPHFNILAHPTGRLINERRPYEVDLEKILSSAADRGCFFEVNAHPDRLDLNDIFCKMAKEIGVKLAISTDAHSIQDLGYMRFGLGQARRGWLEPDDVINTKGLGKLKKLLKRK
jgi:DNA polymerase (family 10)